MIWWVLAVLGTAAAAALAESRSSGVGSDRGVAEEAREIRDQLNASAVSSGRRVFAAIGEVPPVRDLAEMVASMVALGPMDNEETHAEVRALGSGANLRSSQKRLMTIARLAAVYGLEGNPWKVAPDPAGSDRAVWNYKQLLCVQATVAYWASPIALPRDARSVSRDLLFIARQLTVHPQCSAAGFLFDEHWEVDAAGIGGYEGWTADEIYRKEGRPDCVQRRRQDVGAFRQALAAWEYRTGWRTEHVPIDEWTQRIPPLGSASDQVALAAELVGPIVESMLAHMVLWPPREAPTGAPKRSAAAVRVAHDLLKAAPL